MTTQAEKSQIISKHNKFIKGKAKDRAELRLKVTNEYIRLCKKLDDPTDDFEVREQLKERFELTDRRLQNILDNRDRFLNAKALNEYVEHIEDREEAGDDWIDTEKFASTKGENVKSLTPREAKGKVLRERLDIVLKSFEPLKALAPKVIQLEDGRPRFDTTEELDKQIQILEEELKID
jgi:hypothetical protein